MGDSLTKQSFKHECDINNVISHYHQTGMVEHGIGMTPKYGIAPTVDFHQIQNNIAAAKSTFENLKPEVRESFENVEDFFDALGDSNRIDDLVAAGLIKPEITKEEPLSNDENPAKGETEPEETT